MKNNATELQNVEKVDGLPEIYKQVEFQTMLKFIRLGMWRNTNLAKVCGVDVNTLTDWKKRPEVAVAYNEAVRWILEKRKKISDPEKIMKEMDLEVDKNDPSTILVIPLLGGQSAIPSNNSNPQIAEVVKED